jgi:hypothetical protein
MWLLKGHASGVAVEQDVDFIGERAGARTRGPSD